MRLHKHRCGETSSHDRMMPCCRASVTACHANSAHTLVVVLGITTRRMRWG
jgi:hypothetical protein